MLPSTHGPPSHLLHELITPESVPNTKKIPIGLRIAVIEASMPSSHSAAPITCSERRSGSAIRILLGCARAHESSSLGAVPFTSEEELAPLRVLRYTHCSTSSSCLTR